MERTSYSYRFGSAEFDEARFELRVAGLPVEVERRALEVLSYLLRHAGEVVTKEELLREVWAGRITVDKVLPNAINKLRRALGEANAGHISTQARLGYRLDGPIARTAVGRQLASELNFEPGQTVSGRENFVLRKLLGKTRGSEVWLAAHAKTRETRVYKFALDSDHLRSLKREATLLRVLQESLDDCSHFIDIIDWNFENAPYFLECEYGGQSLPEWAGAQLAGLPVEQRIAIFLQIADAVAAAHSVGVLHKDLKPANVLVADDTGAIRVRLTDFGSGRLLDPDRLDALGITQMGMTVTESAASDPGSGTPLYVAPEVFAGQAPTVQSDVFALGILLYQLLSGRITQPMSSGWEQNVADPLLQEDIRNATDGNPERRLASAGELATRLRRLDIRRIEAERQAQQAQEAQRVREALARNQARRPFMIALIAALTAGVVLAVVLQQSAVRARNATAAELERATAITRFVNEDLIGRSNPLVNAKGADATLRDVLLAARSRVTTRFADQPRSEAAIRASLATLFNDIDLWPEAEAEARRALTLYEQTQGSTSDDALAARATLARILSRLGRSDEARSQLDALEKELAGNVATAQSRYLLASVRSTYLVARADYAGAIPELQAAINALMEFEPENIAVLDTLRLDLIACYTFAAEHDAAREEAKQLIAQAGQREEDSVLTIALTKLALVRALGEDHGAVEALLLEAQPVIVERLGENHSRHLRLLSELMGVAFRRADWPKAIHYAQLVHERARSKFGDAHSLTYVTLANWGRSLYEAGRQQEAAVRLRDAHMQLVDIMGVDAPQTQDVAFVLASVELELGRSAAAQAVIANLDGEALEAGRGTGMWSFGIDALRGMLLQQQGNAEAAKPLLESALKGMESEEDLETPGRLYVSARRAFDSIR
jgi:eukaryotic-like serine/threonine-protein kinase